MVGSRCLLVVLTLLITGSGGRALAAQPKPELTPELAPKAEVPELMRYFGVMQPNEVASYSFAIRNVGRSPLKLMPPKGSCRCLTMRLPKREIPPGEEGEVIVQWRAAEKAGESFKQTVRVPTNDPKRPTIDFVIAGDVGGHVRIEPTRLEWTNAAAGEPRKAKVRISSNYWPEMHVSDLRASNPELEVRVVDRGGERSSSLIKSSSVVEITVPAGMTSEDFDALVTMTIAPEQEPEPSAHPSETNVKSGKVAGANDASAEIQIPVSFELASPMTIIGAGYDADEQRVQLGIQKRGQELVRRYLVKLRGETKSLSLLGYRVVPEAVEVALQPYRPAAGLYRLELRVPPNSLGRAYIGEQAGILRLEFDHPRAEFIEVSLEVSPSN